MKATFLSALFAVALVVSFGSVDADDEPKTHRIKIALAEVDGESEVIELGEESLEVGESRQWITESGQEVVATRTEEGLVVTIDGREIRLGDLDRIVDGAHGKVMKKIVVTDGSGLEGLDLEGLDLESLGLGDLVKSLGELGEIGTHGAHVIRLGGGEGLKQHLQTSGALDGLTDDQRQRILDAVESYGPTVHPKVRVLKLGEKDGDSADK